MMDIHNTLFVAKLTVQHVYRILLYWFALIVPKSSRNDNTPVGPIQRKNITVRGNTRAVGSPSEFVDTPVTECVVFKTVKSMKQKETPPITPQEVKKYIGSYTLKLLKEEIGDMNFKSEQFDDSGWSIPSVLV